MKKLSTLDKIFFALVEVVSWGTFVYVLIEYISNLVFLHMAHSTFLSNARIGQELHNAEIYEKSSVYARDVMRMTVERGDIKDIVFTFCLALVWSMYRKYRNNYREDEVAEKKNLLG